MYLSYCPDYLHAKRSQRARGKIQGVTRDLGRKRIASSAFKDGSNRLKGERDKRVKKKEEHRKLQHGLIKTDYERICQGESYRNNKEACR